MSPVFSTLSTDSKGIWGLVVEALSDYIYTTPRPGGQSLPGPLRFDTREWLGYNHPALRPLGRPDRRKQ